MRFADAVVPKSAIMKNVCTKFNMALLTSCSSLKTSVRVVEKLQNLYLVQLGDTSMPKDRSYKFSTVHGFHTCPVRTKNVEKPVDSVRDMLKKNPNIKPSEDQPALLVSSLRNEDTWEKIDKQASQLVNRKWIANQKSGVRRDINPQGENFEGPVTFKHFCDKKDNFYVYKVNDSRGNRDSPSFVFKTSRTKMLIAHNMNMERDDFLSEEYCFFDGDRKRC